MGQHRRSRLSLAGKYVGGASLKIVLPESGKVRTPGVIIRTKRDGRQEESSHR
jgi:hypothetical protein